MPVIATNTAANTALTYLNRNSEDQAKSLAKLSSGSRIVSASDDAAGLAVASRLQADITTLQQASRNALQGRAVLQTADGALARVGEMSLPLTATPSRRYAPTSARLLLDVCHASNTGQVTTTPPPRTGSIRRNDTTS